LYDRLFTKEDPDDTVEGKDHRDNINRGSLKTARCVAEPALGGAKAGERYQFERQGYFCLDEKESKEDKLVFNRITSLRDTWSKVLKKSP
jgi:glutaminyl-tRNA synthetase